MSTIGIMVGTFNEEENVEAIYDSISATFSSDIPDHKFHILFIDNCSTDQTQKKLKALASNSNVSCIFNARNFGPNRSAYHGMINAPGDAVIMMCADFQDPPELLPELVRRWERGNKVVMAKKQSSDEGFFFHAARFFYYKLLKFSNPLYARIHNCTGFGIYDRSVVERLKTIRDPYPFFRGIIAEVVEDIEHVKYHRPPRAAGSSKMSLFNLWDEGVVGLINNSRIILRIITVIGLLISVMSFLAALIYLGLKLTNWSAFPIGIAPLVILQFILLGILMVFLGVISEYIGAIYTQVLDRERVYEEERINI